jgi:hypothetical protein
MNDPGIYKIEKNIPLVGGSRPNLSEAGKMVDALEVGDSVLVPFEKIRIVRNALSWKKNITPGWNYATRTVDGGVRIWRIEMED